MAQVQPSASHRDHPVSNHLSGRDTDRQEPERHASEMSALREENSELRQLVIYLSRLVVRNVIEQEHCTRR
jgi:hypothetical protein